MHVKPPSTTSLKPLLLTRLAAIPDLEARLSPVAGGTALFYRGQEFAHFHHDQELDLRLTRKVIRTLGLARQPASAHHPTRSSSSPWIEIQFQDAGDLARVVALVELAIAQLPGSGSTGPLSPVIQ